MKKKIKIEWIIYFCTALLFIILLVSHNYNDLLITTRHGINFWDILLDGDFFAFYDLNITESGNSIYTVLQGCAYNILVYIVFAVWNLPLYLMERFAGVDVMNCIPCLVYAKLLPVTAMAITAIIVKKIMHAMDIPEKQHKLLLYLYTTSSLIISIIFIVGQYDILSLIFQLLGIYAFIKKQDKPFAIWFGIAFCFKFFALIVFLPLLLLRYKKIIMWIKNLCIVIVIWLITKLPFWGYGFFNRSLHTLKSGGELFAANFLRDMLSSSIISGTLNIFVVVYVAILVWCYLQQNDSEVIVRKSVWVCLISYVAFLGLMAPYPYWSILLAPFVTLVLAAAPQQLYLNMILETVGIAALVFSNMVKYDWVYFGKTLKPMIWPHLLEGTRFDAGYSGSLIHHIIKTLHRQTDIYVIINSIFVAAMAALAFTTYPRKEACPHLRWPEEMEYRDVLLLRFAVNTTLCLLPILAIFL